MVGEKRLLLLSGLAIWGYCCGISVAEQPPGQPPGLSISETGGGTEGLLVLHNGNVLRGSISRRSDRFHVELPHSELQVPAERVEMFCRTLEEAYERRRSVRIGSTADSHLELMRWCLHHQLLDYAARELLDARSIDEHHPAIARLELQLRQELAAAERTRSTDPTKTKVTALPVKPATKATPILENISQGAQATFVRQIQPLLVQACAGCHQPGSARSFQLDRLALAGAGHPDVTKRNLSAVLAQTRGTVADSTPLMNYAQTRHGQSNHHQGRVLTPRQAELLKNWLLMLDAPEQDRGSAEKDAASQTELPKHLRGLELDGFHPTELFDKEAFQRRWASHLEKASAGKPAEAPTHLQPTARNAEPAGSDRSAEDR